MGQTSSHKHMIRSEFAKNNSNMNHNSYSSNMPMDDMAEDEDISCPTLPSKGSYNPNDSIPTFKVNSSRSDSISINKNGEPIHVMPMHAVKKIPVVFKFSSKTARDVQLIGTFTGWKDKVSMIKSDGDFVAIVDLPEGEHQYKFVVDTKWEHDPNQTVIDDNFSGKNNIVIVKKSDFEVMDALAMDSIQQSINKPFQNADDLSTSPTGDYTDEIPIRGINTLAIDKPPYLPPQLLNIVLNKDTSAKCEPTLLPEPNHVMLKHLYALSIRDGVMVLSSTFRFKQKFITTCFYKPI